MSEHDEFDGIAEAVDTAVDPEVAAMAARSARPRIVVNKRDLDHVTDEAIGALEIANNPPSLFLRSGFMARIRRIEDGTSIVENLDVNTMRSELSQRATFLKMLKEGAERVFAPREIAQDVLSRGNLNEYNFPPLVGITEVPVVRRDGTILTADGYDATTRLVHIRQVEVMVPETPTHADAIDAFNWLDTEVFGDFPFETAADRANCYALLLTRLVMPLVDDVLPLAVVDSPEPGTGKSKLTSAIGMLSVGRMPAMSDLPNDDDELRKRITAALLRGSPMVVFDNIEGRVKSKVLASLLTATQWEDRVLGKSENITLPNGAVWIATGNNVNIGGDLGRRTYRIRLNAKTGQPWKRSTTSFRHPNLEKFISENRSKALECMLTMIRAWVVAGRPAPTNAETLSRCQQFGNFSAWALCVGGILEFCGVEEFLANADEFQATADQEALAWEAFFSAWYSVHRSAILTVNDLVSAMKKDHLSPTREALPDELADWFDHSGFTRRLGKALVTRVERHYGTDGLHLKSHGVNRKKLQQFSVGPRDNMTAEERKAFEANFNGQIVIEPKTEEPAIEPTFALMDDDGWEEF